MWRLWQKDTKSQDCWAWWLTVVHAAAVLQSCFPQTSHTLQPTESFLADFIGVIYGSKLGTGVLILINWLAQKVVHFHNIAYLGRTSSTIPWYANPEVKDSSCISSKPFSLYLGLFLLLLSVFNMSENCRDVSKIGNPDREPWYPAGENIWHFRKLGRISFQPHRGHYLSRLARQVAEICSFEDWQSLMKTLFLGWGFGWLHLRPLKGPRPSSQGKVTLVAPNQVSQFESLLTSLNTNWNCQLLKPKQNLIYA